ncbi:MAG: class I SAM-dependent methyltransferase [Anaerolineae bacterium]
MRGVWSHLVALGFRLLYNELAWLYDPVSWLVSRGLWRRWQRTALAYLPPGAHVLEVGFGPGHLLADLARDGHRAVGLDVSRAMLTLARRRLHRRGLAGGLCRGRAEHLPFVSGAFDAVILTFPTPFIYDALWLANLRRVLRTPSKDKPGGRLILVLQASFVRGRALDRFMEWLYRITGQRGGPTDLCCLLQGHGFRAWRERVAVDGTQVGVLLAEVLPAD